MESIEVSQIYTVANRLKEAGFDTESKYFIEDMMSAVEFERMASRKRAQALQTYGGVFGEPPIESLFTQADKEYPL